MELPPGLSGETLSGNRVTFFLKSLFRLQCPGWLSPLEPAPIMGAFWEIRTPRASAYGLSSSRKTLPGQTASYPQRKQAWQQGEEE